ncbi:hypothetical protein [Bacillus phage vB_BanS-Thrax5]|nr:hypothetical protein [Bacillus phage vB_BanS-Thrax5]
MIIVTFLIALAIFAVVFIFAWWVAVNDTGTPNNIKIGNRSGGSHSSSSYDCDDDWD